MVDVIDSTDFVLRAKIFLSEMNRTDNFQQLLTLWRSTNYPYKCRSDDPYSDKYKAEVLQLYEDLSSVRYDVGNEMTSSKLSAAEFEVGFPYTTKDLGVIALETAKVVQAMREIREHGPGPKKI